MKQKILYYGIIGLIFFICIGLVITSGCGCGDTKKAIDETVDGVIGKTAIDHGKKMKKELRRINDKRKKDIKDAGLGEPGEDNEK